MPQHKPNKVRPRKRLLLYFALFFAVGVLSFFLKSQDGFILSSKGTSSETCLPTCETGLSVTTTDQPSFVSETRPLKELLKDDFRTEKVSILIEKAAYKLTVLYESQTVKAYSVVFGSMPVGDKLAEGDRKTPEGIYRIRDAYPHPQWSKFIWLDYPNQQDWTEHERAKSLGQIDEEATIGSEIGIHGTPDGADSLIANRTNWTWGCIALRNRDVDEIYSVVKRGTIVEIVP